MSVVVLSHLPSVRLRQVDPSLSPSPPQSTVPSMVWKYLLSDSSGSLQRRPVEGTNISTDWTSTRLWPPDMINPEHEIVLKCLKDDCETKELKTEMTKETEIIRRREGEREGSSKSMMVVSSMPVIIETDRTKSSGFFSMFKKKGWSNFISVWGEEMFTTGIRVTDNAIFGRSWTGLTPMLWLWTGTGSSSAPCASTTCSIAGAKRTPGGPASVN